MEETRAHANKCKGKGAESTAEGIPAPETRACGVHADNAITAPHGPMSQQNTSQNVKAHIHNLPNECLANVLHRVGDSPLPVPRPDPLVENAKKPRIRHVLHCALICKRWKAIADASISTLNLRTTLTEALADDLGGARLENLTALAVHSYTPGGLVRLARLSPQLERLEGLVGTGASTHSLARALSMWKKLKWLDLTEDRLHQWTLQDVETMLHALPGLHHLSFGFLSENLLPKSLDLYSRLKILCLSQCEKLTSIPHTLGRLGSLKSLQVVSAPNVEAWPQDLRILHTLQSLVINSCGTLPQSLGGLASLEFLSIRFYTSLPEDIGDLPCLRELSLLEGGITELPSSFGRLSSLQVLQLRGSPQLVLPDSLGMLTALTNLQISDCSRQRPLPDSLDGLAKLEVCNLSFFSHLSSLPRGIGAWHRLKKLEITSCWELRALPGLTELSALRHLIIRNCGSVPLPRGLGSLMSLRRLHVLDCRLAQLPASVGPLFSRREMHMARDDVAKIPADIGMLTALTELRLFGYGLDEVPTAIGMLTALAELEIDGGWQGKLVALPDSLGHLTRLEHCTISHLPSLLCLPDSIVKCCRLTKLEVIGCTSLPELPEGIRQLPALNELLIVECPSLTSLPQSSGSFRSLEVLRLRSCPGLTKLRGFVEDLTALQVVMIKDCNAVEYLPLRAWRERQKRPLQAERSHGHYGSMPLTRMPQTDGV